MIKFIKIVIGLIVVVSASGLLAYNYVCPCAIIPGRSLSGELSTEPISDWSVANTVPLCQLEVNPENPHSINLNCMSAQNRLFVSCSVCETKGWAAVALENPEGRIRVDGTIFPVTMRRLTGEAELDMSWKARSDKLGEDPDTPRPEGWWSFEMITR